MSILVIAATDMEIALLRANNPKEKYLITGVGCATTVYHLTKALLLEKYSLVIQVGIAGAFNKNQLLGETVIVEKDCFADMGLFEKKIITNVFEMGFADADSFPFKKGFLVNSYIDLLGLKEHKIVNGISVNLISDNESYFQQLLSKYNADIESMEGAALHYVCLHEQVPFIQIRGISNYIGERDKSKWKIKEAVESSNFLASDIIQAVQQKKQQ